VNAALDGSLANVEMRIDPAFQIPRAGGGAQELWTGRRQDSQSARHWTDKAAYDAQARKLVSMFRENFKKFEAHVSDRSKTQDLGGRQDGRPPWQQGRGLAHPAPGGHAVFCLMGGRWTSS